MRRMSAPPSTPTPVEIKAFRAAVGISQADLAYLLGASTRGVEEWEAGRRSPPPMLRLAMAAINHQIAPWYDGKSAYLFDLAPMGDKWAVVIDGLAAARMMSHEDALKAARGMAVQAESNGARTGVRQQRPDGSYDVIDDMGAL